ncbi:MAG TPA: CoA transferase, partial [Rugosimonospora sp.]|nr:CoA transferase [Rugosimonospora sp.]
PAAPVLSIGEVIDHPYLLERGSVEIVTDEVLGSFAVPGPPFRLSAAGRVALRPAPGLGEHNDTAVAAAGAVRSAV